MVEVVEVVVAAAVAVEVAASLQWHRRNLTASAMVQLPSASRGPGGFSQAVWRHDDAVGWFMWCLVAGTAVHGQSTMFQSELRVDDAIEITHPTTSAFCVYESKLSDNALAVLGPRLELSEWY